MKVAEELHKSKGALPSGYGRTPFETQFLILEWVRQVMPSPKVGTIVGPIVTLDVARDASYALRWRVTITPNLER